MRAGRVLKLAAGAATAALVAALLVHAGRNGGALDVSAPGRNRARDQEQAIAHHRASAVSPEWAKQASEKIERGLAARRADASFQVVEVDCRSVSCLATLEWPSYGSAVREWSRVVAQDYGLPCRVSVYLREPLDQGAKYRATFVYEC